MHSCIARVSAQRSTDRAGHVTKLDAAMRSGLIDSDHHDNVVQLSSLLTRAHSHTGTVVVGSVRRSTSKLFGTVWRSSLHFVRTEVLYENVTVRNALVLFQTLVVVAYQTC